MILLYFAILRNKLFFRGVHEYRKFRLSKVNSNYLQREENKCQVQSSDILYYESNQLPSNEPCEDRLSGMHFLTSYHCSFSLINPLSRSDTLTITLNVKNIIVFNTSSLSVSHVRGTDMYIFSVIDGHGGWQCGSAVKHRLPYYLALYALEDKEITWRNPLNKDDWVSNIF